MTNEQQVLLKLLSKALFDKSVEIQSADWNAVYSEAKAQAVSLHVYNAVPKSMLLPEVNEIWKRIAYAELANNIRIHHNHLQLHRWMCDANIPYVVLKESSSAFYYPDPISRAMGDVDFLVPDNMLDKAGKVLESKGLQPWDEKHIAHIVFRKKGMHLEMHFDPAGIPEGIQAW